MTPSKGTLISVEWFHVGEARRMSSEDELTRCPRCKVEIFWGHPSRDSMDEVLDAVDRGELELGGCVIREKNCCPRCGEQVDVR